MKIVMFILVLSAAAAAQKVVPVPTSTPMQAPMSACPLTIADSPSWGRIKLGMTEQEFQKVFPRMPFMVTKIDLPDEKDFDNVDSMMFTFYREKLEEVTIQFDPGMRWENIGKFTDYLSTTYKLPTTWTISLGTGMLQCKDFAVRAVSSRSELKLRDTVAAKRMQLENAPPKPEPTPQKTRPFPN